MSYPWINLWYIVADWIGHSVSLFFGIIAKIYEGEKMASYNDKLIDSLATRIQLFLFWKSFDGEVIKAEEIEKYIDEIEKFEITNDLANLYSNTYYKTELKKDKKITQDENGNKKEISIVSICNNIPSKTKIKELFGANLKKLKDEYASIFNENFKSAYDDLMKEEKCTYCGIHIDQIKALGKNKKLNNKRSDTRGYTLEIDRKLPNLEYSKENCCMACYWCNNAKTDEFSPKEFKPIAEGIRMAWNERLRGLGMKEIDAPDPKIWETDFDKNMEPDIEK